MRLVKLSMPFILVACLLVCPACQQESTEGEVDDNVALAPVPVSTSIAAAKDLHPRVDLVGVTMADPRKTATISARTMGHVEAVHVTVGDLVEKDALLVSLDPTLFEIARDSAQARVDESRAVHRQLQNGPRPEQIAVATKEVEGASAAASAEHIRLVAAQKLFASQGISDVRVREIAAKVSMLDANVATAKARLALLQAGTRPEMIASAAATLTGAKAALHLANSKLAWANLRAPISGRILDVLIRPGADVSPSTNLARMADLTEVLIEVQLPSATVSGVPAGARAVVTVPGMPSETMSGTFDRLAGNADPATGLMVGWIRVPNAKQRLRPGLTCRVKLSLDVIPGATSVPVQAISDRLGQAVVTVVREHKAYEIPVATGRRVGQDIQILKGVEPGDIVVTEGGYGLPDGCPVSIRR